MNHNQDQHSRPLFILTGPTASGKTALAAELITHHPFELISADARQVYRGLDIGTGKDKTIAQHMIDVVSPEQPFSVSQYRKMALPIIDAIYERGRIPFIVGGTGYYIESLVYKQAINATFPNPFLRAELEHLTLLEAFLRLKEKDPYTAARLDPHNRRRVLRALEIVLTTGKPVKPLERRIEHTAELYWYVLDMPRDSLYKRIDDRVDERIKQGMIEEVEELLETGVSADWLISIGLEYRFVAQYLRGSLDREEMIQKLKFAIHAYARRQLTFFRRWPEAEWLNRHTTESRIHAYF